MMRWLPRLVLSAGLLLIWLTLNGLSAGHAALGAVLALTLPLLLAPLCAPPLQRLRAVPALKLAMRVVWDIGVANVAVARLVLGSMETLRPAFVTVPLDLRVQQGVTLLARIVTITPGTTALDIDLHRQRLLVHVLHTDNPAAVAAGIKARYERLLLEIFEC